MRHALAKPQENNNLLLRGRGIRSDVCTPHNREIPLVTLHVPNLFEHLSVNRCKFDSWCSTLANLNVLPLPIIEINRLDAGYVNPQSSVRSSTLYANEDAKAHRSPSRARTPTISTLIVTLKRQKRQKLRRHQNGNFTPRGIQKPP